MSAFWKWVEKSPECWLWRGSIDPKGYGHFSIKRTTHRAHRVAWELTNGPIPEGMVIDHLCRVRACVNPSHMEIVTPRENTLRGEGPTALNAKKTCCPKGHAYDAENTYVCAKGYRHCRACRAASDQTPTARAQKAARKRARRERTRKAAA